MFPLLLGSHTSYPASDSTNPKLPFDRLIRKLSEAPVSPCWSTTTLFVADKNHWKGKYAIKLYQKVILRWSTSLRVLSGLWFYSVSVLDREPINHHSSPVLFTLHTIIWRCLWLGLRSLIKTAPPPFPLPVTFPSPALFLHWRIHHWCWELCQIKQTPNIFVVELASKRIILVIRTFCWEPAVRYSLNV